MGYLVAVCTGRRATVKRCKARGYLELEVGVRGDQGSGEVSLLAMEQIERANRQLGLAAAPGSFGEHLTVAGIDLRALSIRTLLRIGDTTVLQIVRRGIPPGSYVAYSYQGYPLLAVHGVFCQILRGGHVEKGDAVEVIESAP